MVAREEVQICAGENFDGYTQAGVYTDTYIASNGCDSTRTLLLSVLSNIQTTESVSICEGGNYGGYRSAGTYLDTFISGSGCDSTRTLILSVVSVIETTIDVAICEGDTYEGRTIAGTYTCLLYTSPSPRDLSTSRMPSSA